MMIMRVLVIEDFAPLRKSLVQGLAEAGFAVDSADNGEDGLWLGQSAEHDVIVLDLMLPRLNGLEILKALRKKSSPAHILILTAKDTPADRISGLNLGADDYLVKPFVFGELLARVQALIRRKYETRGNILRIADLELDLSRRTVMRADRPIDLSAREYALLEFLALNARRVVSRTEIWQHVYDANATLESNVVDVFVGLLRKKIERTGRKLLHTRRGLGYLLTDQGDAA
jgi:DNA-binding response OmpR family regulator